LFNPVKEIIAVKSENNTKHVNGQNTELLIIKAGGTCKYNRALHVKAMDTSE
jgi:hypothetical protein